MSTSVNCPPRLKKISSCVRPGVLEVRARLWRPVSALMSEDLPTFERPAKAISGGPIGGRPSDLAAAKKKSQGPAKSLRPASISAAACCSGEASFTWLRLLLEHLGQTVEHLAQIVPKLHLHAILAHDEILLRDRKRVVPGPVDDQARREGAEHEGEDHRHPGEHRLLHGIGM